MLDVRYVVRRRPEAVGVVLLLYYDLLRGDGVGGDGVRDGLPEVVDDVPQRSPK